LTILALATALHRLFGHPGTTALPHRSGSLR
jgi:hypothetical protein